MKVMVADLRSGLVLAAVRAWEQVLHLGPYVLAGTILAALLGQLDPLRRWGRRFRPGRPGIVLGAACLGGMSPISTYGTVPVLLQFLRRGASPGPVLAFLAASSMLNPQLFLLVLGGLGPRVALAQVAGVLLLSLPVGLAASWLDPALFLHPATLSASPPSPAARRRFSWSDLARDVVRLTEWVGLTFVVGVALAAILQVFVPPQWVANLLGEGRRTGVVLAGILGIPLYTCGGAAVPVLSGLTATGMNAGSALAFLLSGPATRVTALAAMGSLLNRRALIVYVVYVIAAAVILGLLLG